MTLADFLELVSKMCRDIEGGHFEPLLEADVAGYLYHLIVSTGTSPKDVHLDTRITQSGSDKYKFDLALGSVTVRHDMKPAVKAVALVEVKAFPKGFKDQQHRVHFEHVLNDDLKKLGSVQSECEKIELLFDDVGYLQGRYKGEKRLDVIDAERAKQVPKAHLLLAQRQGNTYRVKYK
jgi:hypothetical protein